MRSLALSVALCLWSVVPWQPVHARNPPQSPPAAAATPSPPSVITNDVRNRATTGGVNVEFGGGKVRLLADYVSRKIGVPGARRGMLITQAQVKF